jgi:hypothetical protein
MFQGGIAGDVDDVLGIIFEEQDESNHRGDDLAAHQ